MNFSKIVTPEMIISVHDLGLLYVRHAIKVCKENKTQTAQKLGIARTQVWRMMQRDVPDNNTIEFSDELVSLEELEKQYILHALKVCESCMSLAPRFLGISRSSLWRRGFKKKTFVENNRVVTEAVFEPDFIQKRRYAPRIKKIRPWEIKEKETVLSREDKFKLAYAKYLREKEEISKAAAGRGYVVVRR